MTPDEANPYDPPRAGIGGENPLRPPWATVTLGAVYGTVLGALAGFLLPVHSARGKARAVEVVTYAAGGLLAGVYLGVWRAIDPETSPFYRRQTPP